MVVALLSLLVLSAACDDDRSRSRRGVCDGCTVDLAVDEAVLASSLRIERRTFSQDACEVAQGCVDAAGDRVLVHLASSVVNLGGENLLLGAPSVGDRFEFGRCEETPVLRGFLAWRILGAAGEELRAGTVDVSCLQDSERSDRAAAKDASFTCAWQGLQVGWADAAELEGACSWADATGLPPGSYRFELRVDPQGAIAEERTDNNVATVPFEIPAAGCAEPCGGICCPAGVACADERCAMPDLLVDEEALRQSIRFDEMNFAGDDCAVDEGCVEDVGNRRLLRFTMATPNEGGADLVLGDPRGNPLAQWSACHQHFHMVDFASYRLVDERGDVAARGHKQAFCLMDTEPASGDGPKRPRYDCDYQGISRGWSDSYSSSLDCQWVDITGVPEGNYVLEVEVNGARVYEELDYGNNSASVQVFVPEDPSLCTPRPELCWDGRDQDCDGVADDGCDPLEANDTCEDAWLVDGSGTWTARIGDTTERSRTPSCGGAGGALHFALQVLSEELVYVSTYGSELDTVLSVERGDCGSPAEKACADDGCGGAQSHFAGPLAPGQWRVVVQAKEPGASGLVKLNVQRSGCAGAKPIPGPGAYQSDTAAAGADTMTSCGLGNGADELWWFAACPDAGVVDLSTCGSSYDTVLELREGSCRGRAIACNDDATEPGCSSGSAIRTTLAREGLYFLVVDGYLSGDAGPYRLDAEL